MHHLGRDYGAAQAWHTPAVGEYGKIQTQMLQHHGIPSIHIVLRYAVGKQHCDALHSSSFGSNQGIVYCSRQEACYSQDPSLRSFVGSEALSNRKASKTRTAAMQQQNSFPAVSIETTTATVLAAMTAANFYHFLLYHYIIQTLRAFRLGTQGAARCKYL